MKVSKMNKVLKLNKKTYLGITIFIILVIMAIFAPLLTKHDPFEINAVDRLKPPSSENFLGTDEFGRDLYSRVLYGSRISLGIGVSVTLISTVFGTIIGIVSSYYPKVDRVLMRIVDGVMAIPAVLLAIALMSAFGPSAKNVIIALSIIYIPQTARIVRSKALQIKNELYIKALKTQASSDIRIMFNHILPNILEVLAVQITLIFADAIISEASLSFLGVGIAQPTPSWGSIIQGGKVVIFQAGWIVVFPSMAIILAVLSLNLIGDGLKDTLTNQDVTMLSKRKKTRLINEKEKQFLKAKENTYVTTRS